MINIMFLILGNEPKQDDLGESFGLKFIPNQSVIF